MLLPDPDFIRIHHELERKRVPPQLLWAEQVAAQAGDALRYSQFCERHRCWRGMQRRSMRQQHQPGEKPYIDYCGPTVPVVNGTTSEVTSAQIFVAVWGASNYTFAEAGVLLVERWILARLRPHRLFSMAELNLAIAKLLEELNTRALPSAWQPCSGWGCTC